MPSRQLLLHGRTWRVYPSGFLTQSVGDEFGLIFVSGSGDEQQVRFTRYSPQGSRAREQALIELRETELINLFASSQPSARSPEAGYRS